MHKFQWLQGRIYWCPYSSLPFCLWPWQYYEVQNFTSLENSSSAFVTNMFLVIFGLLSFPFFLPLLAWSLKESFGSLQYLFGAMLNVQYVSVEGIMRNTGMEEQINFRLFSLWGLLEKDWVSAVVLLSWLNTVLDPEMLNHVLVPREGTVEEQRGRKMDK